LSTKIQKYTEFLKKVNEDYNTIIKKVAQNISKYFTKITKAINDVSYEFPSENLHRAMLDKLII